MKKFIAAAFFVFPTLALAQSPVSAAVAASIVRQPGVEKCLSVVENNQKGAAQFDAITLVSTKIVGGFNTSIYKLEGSSIYDGDIMGGSWEILVEVSSAEERQTYSCEIVKNLE